jgi:hypothetical protein
LPHGRLAPGERVAVERLWRLHCRLDEIKGLGRRTAARQLAPQACGPGPCLRQVHNPAAQCRWREPECGPAPDRGCDNPDAVCLALGLVDDWPVVRADKETRAGEEGSARADRGLQMGSPRTKAATVDPVGAIRSRTPVIRPRANQISSTKRPVSPPTWRGTYSNTTRPYFCPHPLGCVPDKRTRVYGDSTQHRHLRHRFTHRVWCATDTPRRPLGRHPQSWQHHRRRRHRNPSKEMKSTPPR